MTDAIGALRERVELERPVLTGDELGGASASWTAAGAVWCAIEARDTSEAAASDGVSARTSFVVSIRRREDVRADWRLHWRGRTLNVAGVLDDGSPVMRLLCVEERP